MERAKHSFLHYTFLGFFLVIKDMLKLKPRNIQSILKNEENP